jgi:eukaryotic-like serine/threonine-protein kinase
MPAVPPPDTGPAPNPQRGPARYLIGRYRLDRPLGRGAMGTIWSAYDESLDRWVAIKEVTAPPGTPTSEAQQVAARATREARAIASIADPHVVTVFDLLDVSGTPAIVMELLDAKSVAELLTELGPLGESAAATIGFAVTSALMAAHAAGVTHRDVKPGNVLLCRDGRVKLTDFGIARSTWEHTLTATGLLLGSPAYISPEVAAGEAASAASDAWGLGALLYACVEGVPPFDAGDPLRTLTSVVQDPVPRPRHAGRLTALIGSLMQKDPRRRMPLAHVHRILFSLADDPTAARLVTRAWGSLLVPGSRSRRPRPRPTMHDDAQRRASLAQSRRAVPPVQRVEQSDGGTAPAPAPAGDAPALPPPPWAAGSSASLRALPAQGVGGSRSNSTRLLAVGIAVAALAAGFFGARLVAGPSDHSAPPALTAITPG